ncbi:MAG TPA: patatin-like phospholipase family protein [Bacillota bacterium]|nr:patatin-like phospholipase family protein [Bacillota bacterium]HPJ23762.1 patatin-like phospholipase family protein [Bacillota bacterium]
MKLGLCFSGGGARGAYQIGACMALKEAGILEHVDAFSGTSIGAANAALIATNEVELVKKLWFDMPEETIYKTEGIFHRLLKERTKSIIHGFYEIDHLEEILKENLDISKLREKEVYVTLSDGGDEDSGFTQLIKNTYRHYLLKDSKAVYVQLGEHEEEHIFKEIIASCSIPIVFAPTVIDGKRYYDGGVYDNVPVKPLIEAGCDTIIVLHLDRLPYFYKYRYKDITFHTIKSWHSLGRHLKFESGHSANRYHLGYNDCKKYLETNQIL